ncbi:MAG: DNA repair protein RecO C-terminal domain-containing protein [Bacteroidales bacterium]|nr:DNA repair protein RecO C-terminal domain-containing protein [Bacteroidales bacterium]
MRERARILVLNTTLYGEKSLIVHCISDLWGRRSFITSRGGKTSAGLFSPMNILDCEVTPNTKSDLWRLHSPALRHPLMSIRSSIPKTSISLFMSEVLYRTVREPVADDSGLFNWCEQSVLTLDALESDYSNFHLVFLLGLAAALGFRPTAESMAPYAGENFLLLKEFLTTDTAGAMLISLSGSRRADLCRCILKYLEHHTESRIEVKSLDVLHELFA